MIASPKFSLLEALWLIEVPFSNRGFLCKVCLGDMTIDEVKLQRRSTQKIIITRVVRITRDPLGRLNSSKNSILAVLWIELSGHEVTILRKPRFSAAGPGGRCKWHALCSSPHQFITLWSTSGDAVQTSSGAWRLK